MKIKKIGHCCLRIEEQGSVILTDPGIFSSTQNLEKGLDAVLITHEHQDHLHTDSLRIILENNPNVKVYGNGAVKKVIDSAGMNCIEIQDNEPVNIHGVFVEAFSSDHESIYEGIEPVWNSGFLIADKLYLPGDSLHNPNKKIEILAAPVVGP